MATITPDMWADVKLNGPGLLEKLYSYEYQPLNHLPSKSIKFKTYDQQVNVEDVFQQTFFTQADVDKLIAEAVAWHAAEIATLREALVDHGDGHLDVLDWEELTDDEQ